MVVLKLADLRIGWITCYLLRSFRIGDDRLEWRANMVVCVCVSKAVLSIIPKLHHSARNLTRGGPEDDTTWYGTWVGFVWNLGVWPPVNQLVWIILKRNPSFASHFVSLLDNIDVSCSYLLEDVSQFFDPKKLISSLGIYHKISQVGWVMESRWIPGVSPESFQWLLQWRPWGRDQSCEAVVKYRCRWLKCIYVVLINIKQHKQQWFKRYLRMGIYYGYHGRKNLYQYDMWDN